MWKRYERKLSFLERGAKRSGGERAQAGHGDTSPERSAVLRLNGKPSVEKSWALPSAMHRMT